MEHLSDDWISAFDNIVRNHDGLRGASAGHRVVIQYTVSDEPLTVEGDATAATDVSEVEYAIVLDHGDNRVIPGRSGDPDITLRTDRRTAAAIATHAESAQTAFMSGRLRLGGDVRVLIATQSLLVEIDDCTADLRAATDAATTVTDSEPPPGGDDSGDGGTRA